MKNNEEQEGKINLFWDLFQWEGGGHKERENECVYGSIFCIHI
jgi:hypothetical protein